MSASVEKCPDCGKPLSAAVHVEDRSVIYLYCTAIPCNPLLIRNLGPTKVEPIMKKKKRKRGYR